MLFALAMAGKPFAQTSLQSPSCPPILLVLAMAGGPLRKLLCNLLRFPRYCSRVFWLEDLFLYTNLFAVSMGSTNAVISRKPIILSVMPS